MNYDPDFFANGFGESATPSVRKCVELRLPQPIYGRASKLRSNGGEFSYNSS